MGKGTIQSHLGEGKYSVKLLLHRARVEARIQELTDAINQVDTIELAAAETALTDAQAALDQAISDQDAAIVSLDREAMAAAARTVAEKAAARDKARVERDRLKLRLASLKKEKTYLESNTPNDPVVEAWCADLTEDLTGEVATLEIPGERNGVPPLIRPGHNGQAAHNSARDGQLQPSIASTPAGVFYNWSMLPGWQKWKPTHRLGTIATLSGDTCTVDLDQALSSAQNLPVNQATRLTDVPIVYMTCHGGAFQLNDRVVVEFQDQDWSKPRVIGFESNPRPCGQNLLSMQWYPQRITHRQADGTRINDIYPGSVSSSPGNYRGVQEFVSGYQGDTYWATWWWPSSTVYYYVQRSPAGADSAETVYTYPDIEGRYIAAIASNSQAHYLAIGSTAGGVDPLVRLVDHDWNDIADWRLAGKQQLRNLAANAYGVAVLNQSGSGEAQGLTLFDLQGELMAFHDLTLDWDMVQCAATKDTFLALRGDGAIFQYDKAGAPFQSFAAPARGVNFKGLACAEDRLYVGWADGHVIVYERAVTRDEAGNILTDEFTLSGEEFNVLVDPQYSGDNLLTVLMSLAVMRR